MLLLIAFQLSAQVLCTFKDTSVSRLLEEGFAIADEVMDRDSHGFKRLSTTQYIGNMREEGTEVVPSWLLGGGGGTTVIHLHGGDPALPIFEVRERVDWSIRYYCIDQRETATDMLYYLSIDEVLRREPYTYQDEIVYFSRPVMTDAGCLSAYVIYARDERFPQIAEQLPLLTRTGFASEQLSFRQISNLMHTIIGMALRLRRHSFGFEAILADYGSISFHRSMTDRERIFVIPPKHGFGFAIYRDEREDERKLFAFMAFIMHGQLNPDVYYFAYIDQVISHAFYRDSETPDPIRLIRFRTLRELLGDEFAGYQLRSVRNDIQEWLGLIREEWYKPEPNPAAIPSIADFITGVAYILK
jgi:hypothetical protein